MNKDNKQFLKIITRYLILLLVAVPNFWLFYAIFTPLTVYFVHLSLSIFFDTLLTGNVIILDNRIPIEIIPACVAGSAYYLLLILNLSIAKIKLKDRIKMISLSFLIFLLINVLRIFILSVMLLSNFNLFLITHKIFWYVMSTVFVVGIWFFEVKLFKIKEIPFYSDLKFLYQKSNLRK